MNREELMAILPHREPMLLIDEATAVDETHCVGKYTVRGDEWFLQGFLLVQGEGNRERQAGGYR